MSDRPHSSAGTRKRVAIAIDVEQVVPWHQDCCEGILRYGRSRGWSCSITPYLVGPGGQEAAGLYDGVVGRIGPELAEAAKAQGIPVVNHWINSPVRGLPSVGLDNRFSAQMAGEHLLSCGYRTLKFLGGQADQKVVRYVEGLNGATASAGLEPVEVRLFKTGDSVTSSRAGFVDFLSELDGWMADVQPPVGWVLSETTLALYLVQQCVARGLNVPQDVGIVVCHDDVGTSSLSPTLTVVEQDWSEVGYQAAALLDELMQGKATPQLHRIIPPIGLVRRESTDVFLCDDALVKSAMRYIAEHCREQVNVNDLADAMNVSRRTLERRFDEALGKTIYEEIVRLRTEHIKRLLVESDLPLAAIGLDCGFRDASYFATYFRKATGMTPGAYRKTHKVQKAD